MQTDASLHLRNGYIAMAVPVTAPGRARSLAGSIIGECGDPYSTGEVWDADRS